MEEHDFASISVAVVDDNRNFLKLMRSILRSFNVGNIYETEDAYSTLECLCTRQVDILLADHLMPGITGCELIRLIRSERLTPRPDLPIICISGHGDRTNVENAIRVGADDFLVKPVRPVDIFRRLVKQVKDPLPRVRSPAYAGPDRRRGGLANTHSGDERRTGPEPDARAGPAPARAWRPGREIVEI